MKNKKLFASFVISICSFYMLSLITNFVYIKQVDVINNAQQEQIYRLTHDIKTKDNEINDLKNSITIINEDIEILQNKIIDLDNKLNIYELDKVNSVTYIETYNPHEKTNCSVEQLNVMLESTALKNCGEYFKEMEDTYDINAVFSISVAIHESAYMTKPANKNNYFGFRGSNGWMSFNSIKDSILYFGKLISTSYNDLLTIEKIQYKYCPDNSDWANSIKYIMKTSFNSIK